MEEKDFNSQTQQFVQNVSQHITYIYTAFVPEDCENILNTMKSDIWPAERHLLPNRRAVALRFICPYDLMMNGMDKKIREFYAEFQLSDKTQRQLAHYGDRAEILTKQFQKELDTAYRTTIRTARRELDLMVMQGKTAKETITHMRMVLNKRINTLKKQLQNFAGQTERIMVLWEYQDCGYERYRYVSVGETCDDCTALDGEIFAISELQPGVNFGPLHPNCDCRADILDHAGAVVFSFVADKKDDETKSPPQKTKSFWDYFSLKTLQESDNYLIKSLRQLLLGNYTDDVTFLGTLAEIAAGLLNLDLPMDVRDLVYDVTHWENTPKHAVQTLLDIVALLPVIGSTKYGDEVGALIKSVFKHGDEAADAAKAAAKHADEVADAAKAATDIIDGKVAGKIPLDEYAAIRKRSVKNAQSDTLTLGKFARDETSYTVRAGKTSYFDLGDEWTPIRKQYGLSEDDMFEVFNKPVLEEALEQGKTIRFSHNPLNEEGFLKKEWLYVKEITGLDDTNLIKKGDFWYVDK